jgi:hypothetical protein
MNNAFHAFEMLLNMTLLSFGDMVLSTTMACAF